MPGRTCPAGGSDTDIAIYNTFVQGRAATGHADIQDYSTGFRAVGCTADTDARDNTSTTGTGVAIYWLNGAKVADHYADFYDGSWDNQVNNKNESGTSGPVNDFSNDRPWTGCAQDGTEVFFSGESLALGSSNFVRLGRPNSSSGNDGPLSSTNSAAPTNTNTPPTASDGTVTTNGDTDYTFAATDFNFSDADGNALSSVRIVTLPGSGKGTLALSGTPVTANQVVAATDIGTLAYTPPANANGASYASFTFTVNDGTDDSATPNTMTVNVTVVNDAPTVATEIPDRTATAGTAFSYMFPDTTFADADSDMLTYAATKPDGTTVNLTDVDAAPNVAISLTP